MPRRPTFYPAYQDTPLDVPKFLAQPKSALLAQLVTALADLAAPKQALPLLHDPARISFYEAALGSLMAELPGELPLLVTSGLQAARSACCLATPVAGKRPALVMLWQWR